MKYIYRLAGVGLKKAVYQLITANIMCLHRHVLQVENDVLRKALKFESDGHKKRNKG